MWIALLAKIDSGKAQNEANSYSIGKFCNAVWDNFNRNPKGKDYFWGYFVVCCLFGITKPRNLRLVSSKNSLFRNHNQNVNRPYYKIKY